MTNVSTKHDAFLDYVRGRLKAEFVASPELRAEFMTGEDYVAYTLNTATAKSLLRQWRADHEETESLAALNVAEAAGRT